MILYSLVYFPPTTQVKYTTMCGIYFTGDNNYRAPRLTNANKIQQKLDYLITVQNMRW